jgi:hypothetical protein
MAVDDALEPPDAHGRELSSVGRSSLVDHVLLARPSAPRVVDYATPLRGSR